MHRGQPLPDGLGRRVAWLHHNVSPFALAGFLACAASLEKFTAHAFVAFFAVWLAVETLRLGLALHRRGLARWLWDSAAASGRWFGRRVLELRRLYWAKTAMGLAAVYLTASTTLWASHHLDLRRFLSAALDSLVSIPRGILDAHLLIIGIHEWLNRMLLSHVAAVMSALWSHASGVIAAHPALGLLYIALPVVALCAAMGLADHWAHIAGVLADPLDRLDPWRRAEERRSYASDARVRGRGAAD